MDRIDDARKRGAYNDLSVLAYEILLKYIACESELNQIDLSKKLDEGDDGGTE